VKLNTEARSLIRKVGDILELISHSTRTGISSVNVQSVAMWGNYLVCWMRRLVTCEVLVGERSLHISGDLIRPPIGSSPPARCQPQDICREHAYFCELALDRADRPGTHSPLGLGRNSECLMLPSSRQSDIDLEQPHLKQIPLIPPHDFQSRQ